MKKLLALLLALAMVLSLAACGGSAQKTEAPAAQFRVAMISDYAGITDQSFNQTTWEACQAFGAATGTEIKYYKPVTNDTAGRGAHHGSVAGQSEITALFLRTAPAVLFLCHIAELSAPGKTQL